MANSEGGICNRSVKLSKSSNEVWLSNKDELGDDEGEFDDFIVVDDEPSYIEPEVDDCGESGALENGDGE